MVFCLSLLACPPQSPKDCPSMLTKVLLQQMPWIVASHREHMHYYQNFFEMTLKHPCCYVNILKREKKRQQNQKTLFLKLLIIQNCSCSLNLLCLLPSSRRNQGKKTKPPLTSTTHNQILTLTSTYKHIFSVSPCCGSVENDFIIGRVWLMFRDKTR